MAAIFAIWNMFQCKPVIHDAKNEKLSPGEENYQNS